MKQTDRKVPLTRILVFVFLFILIISSVLFVISLWEKQQEYEGGASNTSLGSSEIEYEGESYELNSDIETVLIIGLDKFEETVDETAYSNERQADFIMLFVLDNSKETCTALQINRDTMTDMNILGVAGMEIGTIKQQIALAHTYGNGQNVSCRNTAKAVSNLLSGMKVDHYVSITMDAVPLFNDMVGGVTLEVLDNFGGIDDALTQGENVTLAGDQALTYVRSRYGMDDSTNGHRMIRQRQYLEALYNKTVERSKEEDSFVIDAVDNLSEYMVSDCYVQDLKILFDKVTDFEYLGTKSIEGESVKGDRYIEFNPDEAALNRLVVDLFYSKKS